MTHFVYAGKLRGADDPRVEYLKKLTRASITWRGEYSHAYFIDVEERDQLPVGVSAFQFGDYASMGWKDKLASACVTVVFSNELEPFTVAMRNGLKILMPANHPALPLLNTESQVVPFSDVNDFYRKVQTLLDEGGERMMPGRRWKQIEGDRLVWARFAAAFGQQAASTDDRSRDAEAYRKAIREKGWQEKENIYLDEFEWFTRKPCESPRISIVIISYEYNPDVLLNLQELMKQPGHQLIFVNNGGTVEEFEPVAGIPHIYLKLKENKGAYLARNAGAVFATAPIILFLDDDALPAKNLIQTHIDNFQRYDILSLRGVCLPRTNNPFNGLPRHYYLGDEPFPRFANIEGNTSYRSDIFFRAGGWSDDIRFGGGGLDLALRILQVDPDLQKHMFSPEPVIYHDYVNNTEHLAKKSEKQHKSRSRLFRKYPDHLEKVSQWNTMRHRTNLLHVREGFTVESNVMTEAKRSPQLYRLLQVRSWQYKFGYYDYYWSHVDEFNPPDEVSISVVFVAERLDDQLRESIRRIKRQADHVSVVVVNNAGDEKDFTDPGCDYLVHLKKRANKNTARNLGSLMVKSPVILFLGNHCIPTDNLIKRHLDTFLKFRVVTLEGEILMEGDELPQDKRTYSVFPVEEDHISFLNAGFVMIKGFVDHVNEDGIHEFNLRMMNIAADLAQNRHDPGCVVYSKKRRGIRQEEVMQSPPLHLQERPWQMKTYRNWLALDDQRYRMIPHQEAIEMNNLLNQSGQLLAQGRLKEALPGFEKCAVMNPLNFQCASMLSYTYLNLGELEKARRAILPAVTMLPLNEDMVGNHVAILLQMGKIEEAKSFCEGFLAQKTHVKIQKILVQIEEYMKQNRMSSATPEERLIERTKAEEFTSALQQQVYDFLRNKGESEPLAMWYMKSMVKEAKIQPASRSVSPKVSIVIPCHNYGQYLRECVESVLWQTFTDWEMIIINDGSTDDTHEVAQQILKAYPDYRIRYHSQECKGIVQPRNYGVSISQGQYILALDADDLLAPTFLEKTVPILDSRPEVAYVSTKALFFGISNKIWPRSQFSPLNLPVTNQQTNTTLFRRAMWDDLRGWDERMSDGYVDWEFWVRGTKKGWLGEQLDDCLFFYRRKGDSTVMAAKNKGARLKLKIMALNPEIYTIANATENDPRLERKNYIDPSFIRKDFVMPERKTAESRKRNSMILRIDPQSQPQPQKKKPRILFVCHDFPPYRMAGAQLYAMNLAKKLNEVGAAEVDVLYAVWRDETHRDYSIRESRFEGLRVYELGKMPVNEPMKIFDERVIPAVQDLLLKNEYKAMHVHGLGQITLAPAMVAHKLGIPVYATLHDYWLLCDHWHMIREDQSQCSGPESAEKCARCHIEDYIADRQPGIEKKAFEYQQFRREMMRKLFTTYNRVFAPSRYLAERFAEFGFKGIEVAPLGFEYGDIKTARPGDGLFHFGYTGQLIPRKGVNFLIDAFMKLPHEHARLDIYGPVEAKYALDLQVRSSSDSRIKFHGRYQPERLDAIMRTFDIAMVPSLMENYPLVVQEAFLRKTPVIATSVGGIPEVVVDGENGYMVEPESAESILDAMRRAIEDPSCVDRFSRNIKPVRRLMQDAEHYATVYSGNKVEKPVVQPPKKLCVQFYIEKNVHLPMFRTLMDYLRGKEEVEQIVICIPDFLKLTSTDGRYQNLEDILAYPATFTNDPRAIPVDVTFIADAIAGKVAGAGKIVNIGHGTISKGIYFSDSVWLERQNWADLLCVPGEYALKEVEKALDTRVVATGMPKLDPVFSGSIDTQAVRRELNIPHSKKIVLYAPTFNLDLSSLYDFVDRFHELRSDEYDIVIKLHGSTPGSYSMQYHRIAEQTPGIHFYTGDDLAPLLALSDVMISDVSSAWMEFMALDKPVILYSNPNASRYHGYDRNNIEWAWRDLGSEVTSFDELKRLLPAIVRSGDGKSTIRMNYARLLFADVSGKACENVWNATKDVLSAPERAKPPIVTLVLRCDRENLAIRRDQLQQVLTHSVMAMRLLIVSDDRSPELSEWVSALERDGRFVDVKRCQRDPETLDDGLYIWITDDAEIFKDFDYFLYLTFKSNPGVSVLTTCSNIADRGGSIPADILLEHQTDPSRFAFDFIYRYKGKAVVPCGASDPAVLAIDATRIQGRYSDTVRELIQSGMLPCALSVYANINDERIKPMVWNYLFQKDRMPAKQRYELGMGILDSIHLSSVALVVLETAVELGAFEALGRLLSIIYRVRANDLELHRHLMKLFENQPQLQTFIRQGMRIAEKLSERTEVTEQKKHRAMFYFFKNVHVPILMQLYRKFTAMAPNWDVAFSFMPWAPQIRAGFTPQQIEALDLPNVTITRTPQEFLPDITFIADSAYPWVQNCGKLVHVGHGVLSKGQYYTNTDIARRDDAAALVCVPGSIHKQNLQGVLRTRVDVTGMAKLDPLFSGEISREKAAAQLRVSAEGRYILFAPTFNDELSAIPFVQDRIVEVLPVGYSLLIKLHGSAKQEYVQMYAALARRNANVHLIDDLTTGMVLADVMISDVSSAMMEFAALDKPVVLFDNPSWRQYANFNPNDIDFRWRDIGIRVRNLEEMRIAVERSLRYPDEFADKRKLYTDQLFANKYDGKASERIVASAMSLMGERPVVVETEEVVEDSGVVFTYVGDFSKERGVHVLLDAFSKLPQEGWTLKLYGNPATAWDIAEFNAMMSRIKPVRIAKDSQALNGSDVMVLPSRDVLTQSLKAGVPAIVADADGVRDHIRDRLEGFVIPSGDAEALHRTVKILVGNPKMIQTMKESVRANHSS